MLPCLWWGILNLSFKRSVAKEKPMSNFRKGKKEKGVYWKGNTHNYQVSGNVNTGPQKGQARQSMQQEQRGRRIAPIHSVLATLLHWLSLDHGPPLAVAKGDTLIDNLTKTWNRGEVILLKRNWCADTNSGCRAEKKSIWVHTVGPADPAKSWVCICTCMFPGPRKSSDDCFGSIDSTWLCLN